MLIRLIMVLASTCTVVSVIIEYPYKTKTKNKPIIQVKLHVRTLSSRIVPGPGSSLVRCYGNRGAIIVAVAVGGVSSIPPYR